MMNAMTSNPLVGARNVARPMNLKRGGNRNVPRLHDQRRIAPSTALYGISTKDTTNSACDLGQKLLINTDIRAWVTASPSSSVFTSPSSYLVLTLLAAGFLATAADATYAAESASSANAIGAPMYTLAENEDFWANVLRYVSYFFSVLLGTAYVAFKPIVALLKRPTTAILVIVAFAGLYYFVSTTVKAMIGVDEFAYEPSSIVTPYVQ